jgi:hypothetical protein
VTPAAAVNRAPIGEVDEPGIIWVLSAADLVLHKLVAGRAKELADIQNILAILRPGPAA